MNADLELLEQIADYWLAYELQFVEKPEDIRH